MIEDKFVEEVIDLIENIENNMYRTYSILGEKAIFCTDGLYEELENIKIEIVTTNPTACFEEYVTLNK
ncbi:hypothetical protein [Clostridioides difficile]|uniref:hypothetical protein n=1 Tax=Clostridioides difficile TaxID=1496 RepID=UPI000F61488C|nr:hypothetical protein [Clostridioides difficile]MCJ0310942.1 hypothetical protein [Clostridioides difficile]MCJ0378220.1 hypothetical protein [Clostridioides difficile]MCJ0412136.1 hypothetical protein [Clostridioides difficile]MCO8701875.1 hypothetical protein [Clostridioides difficile]MCP8652492.1 hypothetical protein [Clostridioides difficile]